MNINPKALYNMLRSRYEDEPELPVEPWQVEQYRELPTEELFERLRALGLSLQAESFLLYAAGSDTPEELIEVLWTDETDEEGVDEAYLLIFELWRRLLPEKGCLSLFCDELDYRIEQYDLGVSTADEMIQEAFSQLEDLLDESADEGGEPQEIFSQIAGGCAHDLESFLYDYIATQILERNDLLASELIDGFYDYVSDPRFLDLLRIRLFFLGEVEEGAVLLDQLVEDLTENPDLDLLLELGYVLSERNERKPFFKTVALSIPLLEVEEDFQDLLAVVADFFRSSGESDLEQKIEKLIARREEKDLMAPLLQKDPDFKTFCVLLDAEK